MNRLIGGGYDEPCCESSALVKSDHEPKLKSKLEFRRERLLAEVEAINAALKVLAENPGIEQFMDAMRHIRA